MGGVHVFIGAEMNTVNTLGSRAELSLPPVPGARLPPPPLRAQASDFARFHLTQPPLPPNTPLTPTPLALDGDSDTATDQHARRRRKARSKRKRRAVKNEAVSIPRLPELYLSILQHTKAL